MKFKLFEEVMDKNGTHYTVVLYKDLIYEVMPESDLASTRKMSEIDLARYSPLLAPILAQITEEVAHIETMIQGIKATQADIFERAQKNET